MNFVDKKSFLQSAILGLILLSTACSSSTDFLNSNSNRFLINEFHSRGSLSGEGYFFTKFLFRFGEEYQFSDISSISDVLALTQSDPYEFERLYTLQTSSGEFGIILCNYSNLNGNNQQNSVQNEPIAEEITAGTIEDLSHSLAMTVFNTPGGLSYVFKSETLHRAETEMQRIYANPQQARSTILPGIEFQCSSEALNSPQP